MDAATDHAIDLIFGRWRRGAHPATRPGPRASRPCRSPPSIVSLPCVLRHRSGTPAPSAIKGSISLCKFQFRPGPDRRRWGPKYDVQFRGLARVLARRRGPIAVPNHKQWLEAITQELCNGACRPQPLLRVLIPKRNGGQGPLRPEVDPLAGDPNNHLVQVPSIARPGTAPL
jgi:hypothetical protein